MTERVPSDPPRPIWPVPELVDATAVAASAVAYEDEPVYDPLVFRGEAVFSSADATESSYTATTTLAVLRPELGAVQADFEADLLRALRDESVEDGIKHVGELLLLRAMETYPYHSVGWIQEVFIRALARPERAAGLLRCVVRLHPAPPPWAALMVSTALGRAAPVLREEAMRAIERWGGSQLLALLQAHEEPQGWLRDYASCVLADWDRQ